MNTTVTDKRMNALVSKIQKEISETYTNNYIVYAHGTHIYLLSVDNRLTGTILDHMKEYNLSLVCVSDAYIATSTLRELNERFPTLDAKKIKIEAMFEVQEE